MKKYRTGTSRRVLASLCAGLALTTCAAFAQTTLPTEDEMVARAKADATQRGITLSAEQELRLRLQYRQLTMMQGVLSGRATLPAAAAAAPTAAAPAQPAGTPETLNAQVQQLPAPAYVDVVARKDGFQLDGNRVVDPEGRIVRQSVSSATGDYTYMVERSDASRLVKRGRGAATAFLMATVTGRPGAWQVRGADGQTLEAEALTLTPNGLIGMRETAAFEWTAGAAIKARAIPDGWTATPLQRGEVAATRYVLVERSADAQPRKGSLDGLFQAAKRLTGQEQAQDYALLHLDTGKLTPLTMDVGDKNVTRMSDCRKKNAVVNLCSKAESYESLWKPDGSANTSHYFWRVMWMNTPQGPMAVAHQDSTKEIRLFDLTSGKEVVAFRRPLGIAGWSVRQERDGRVQVKAQLAFTQHQLDDAGALLRSAPDQHGQPVEGTIVLGKPDGEAAATAAAPASAPAN